MLYRSALATLLASACLWLDPPGADPASGGRGAVAAPRTGIYGLTVARDFHDAVTAVSTSGFELAVVGATSDQLDVLQAQGMKGLAGLWLQRDVLQSEATWLAFMRDVRAAVTALAAHPALYAWYVADEPDGEGIPPEKMKEMCDAIRAIDPRTPLLAVFNTPESWGAYLPLVDIVATDPYLRRNGANGYAGPEVVAEWIDRVQRDLRDRSLPKEVWVVLGAFTQWRKDGSAPEYRLPSPDEFRAMVQMARQAGVGGIVVYSYAIAEDSDVRRWDLPDDAPALWSAVRGLPAIR